MRRLTLLAAFTLGVVVATGFLGSRYGSRSIARLADHPWFMGS